MQVITKTVAPRTNRTVNRIDCADLPVHRWYRFVLSFPPHLVRDYLHEFDLKAGGMVLDPFCGTGTTLVECKKSGVRSVGLEAMPMARFASQAKIDWQVDPDNLMAFAQEVATLAGHKLRTAAKQNALRTLPAELSKLLIAGSIAERPLHKTLVLMDSIRDLRSSVDGKVFDLALLALAKMVVNDASNLHFGPEVGVRRCRNDAPVVQCWLKRVEDIHDDLCSLSANASACAHVHLADSRQCESYLEEKSVDAVICSPPYPNEKDYSRTTRLESVILGFANSMEDIRSTKKTLVRSNTRSVYKDDDDDRWIAGDRSVENLCQKIEQRRVALGKTSGFEKNYAKVTRQYFGGIARHLATVRPVLKPGARLAYVLGDQASYFRVLIRTGAIFGEIAESHGYEWVRTDLFRTRQATATRSQLREEVIVLRWPGR